MKVNERQQNHFFVYPQVTTQFDTLVSQNKALKNEINMMLKLRGSFYRRMIAIKTLSSQIKQRMGEVVYEATAAYDQRSA